jgi:hypothetical protein
LDTEAPLECVDAESTRRAVPLQDTHGDHTAGEVMPLRPLGTRWTATQAEVIRTDSPDLRKVCADAVHPPDLRCRHRQTVGGLVRGAVSDDQDVQAARPPAGLRPIRLAPIGPEGWAAEATVLLPSADAIPPIGAKPCQAGSAGLPGLTQPIRRAAAPAMAGIAAERQRPVVFGGSPGVPQAEPPRAPKRPVRPHQQDEGETLDRVTLLTRTPPAKPSRAGAHGVASTGSSRLRAPCAQANRGRQATSRRVGPDPCACNSLVKRSCDTVSRASASSTQVAAVRQYRQAVR